MIYCFGKRQLIFMTSSYGGFGKAHQFLQWILCFMRTMVKWILFY